MRHPLFIHHCPNYYSTKVTLFLSYIFEGDRAGGNVRPPSSRPAVLPSSHTTDIRTAPGTTKSQPKKRRSSGLRSNVFLLYWTCIARFILNFVYIVLRLFCTSVDIALLSIMCFSLFCTSVYFAPRYILYFVDIALLSILCLCLFYTSVYFAPLFLSKYCL